MPLTKAKRKAEDSPKPSSTSTDGRRKSKRYKTSVVDDKPVQASEKKVKEKLKEPKDKNEEKKQDSRKRTKIKEQNSKKDDNVKSPVSKLKARQQQHKSQTGDTRKNVSPQKTKQTKSASETESTYFKKRKSKLARDVTDNVTDVGVTSREERATRLTDLAQRINLLSDKSKTSKQKSDEKTLQKGKLTRKKLKTSQECEDFTSNDKTINKSPIDKIKEVKKSLTKKIKKSAKGSPKQIDQEKVHSVEAVLESAQKMGLRFYNEGTKVFKHTEQKTKITSSGSDLNRASAKIKTKEQLIAESHVMMSSHDESESDDDWEEVEDLPGTSLSPAKSQIPKDPVQITLDVPDFSGKRRKKKFDMEAYFNRMMNRFQKELKINMHKVHLLCLLGNGLHVNSICNDPTLQALVLSKYTEEVPAKCRMETLGSILKCFRAKFSSIENDEDYVVKDDLLEELCCSVERGAVAKKIHLVFIFCALLRMLGMDTRLILSFQPVSMKMTPVKKTKKADKNENSCVGDEGDNQSNYTESSEQSKNTEVMKKESAPENVEPVNANKPSAEEIREALKCELSPPPAHQESGSTSKTKLKTKNSRKRKSASKTTCYLEDSDEDDTMEMVKKKTKKSNSKGKKPKPARRKSSVETISSQESDEDFEVEFIKYRKSPETATKQRKKRPSKPAKVVSSDSDNSVQIVKAKIKETGTDAWVEVYLEAQKRWICIDCISVSMDTIEKLEKQATQPVTYVMAFDNENSIKDVTERYASNWMSYTRKARIDEEWWEETLRPYRPDDTEKQRKEDLQFRALHLKRPLPTSIGEFKNHPLYALKRHLLKFQAIYPETSLPVGFIRGEAVYARDCVHTLHSRETWLKEARAVRIGEKPYKLVKPRPKKRDRGNPQATAEATLEIFGRWQTEPYIPMPAVNGKVPRNEYGNVELFQPSMLPGGTVHLNIPGLNKVAKKLDIDCAPAMTGWDVHGGWSHPLLEGWIVCEEHKDVLLAAWDEEQEIIKQKEQEKREKRALENWKLLIRGLLIKEKLKNKYSVKHAPHKSPTKKESKTKDQKANDTEMAWPQNRQESDSGKHLNKSQQHLFPSEKM